MPFGLKNALATFQCVIKAILDKHKLKGVLNYFDDITVHSSNLEDHLKQLDAVLTALRAENVKLKWKKSHFIK